MAPPKNKKSEQQPEKQQDAATEEKVLPASKRQKLSGSATTEGEVEKKEDVFDVKYWSDLSTPAGQIIDPNHNLPLAPPRPQKTFEQWYYERYGDPVPEEFENEERPMYTQEEFDQAFANKDLYREK